MKEARILGWDASREYGTAELCAINELSNDPGDPAVSIARASVKCGVTTRWHRVNGIAERYVILEGRGMVEVGALPPAAVGPGDVVWIPAGVRQRIHNDGEGDLIFLAICTPRFVPEAYEDVEDKSL